MQSCIPVLIFTNDVCKLDLRGGTNADHAPPIDYYESVCIYFFKFQKFKFLLKFYRYSCLLYKNLVWTLVVKFYEGL